ncbi:MAG: hypothetical protein KAT46_02800 [Deltaproteobacteria bacterium]|nr:hypothetical protein [Deltaproteobacteria bacterium]
MKIFNLSESVKKYYIYTELTLYSLLGLMGLTAFLSYLAVASALESSTVPLQEAATPIITLAIYVYGWQFVLLSEYKVAGIIINSLFYFFLFFIPIFGFVIKRNGLRYLVLHFSCVLMAILHLRIFFVVRRTLEVSASV